MRSNVSGSLNDCDEHCCPHGGHRRPIDPRERWRKMVMDTICRARGSVLTKCLTMIKIELKFVNVGF